MFVILLVLYAFHVGSAFEVRLAGGNGPHEGNVQIFHDSEWKYICDDEWGIRDAKVVCRELNYTKALKATNGSFFSGPHVGNEVDFNYNATYWSTRIHCTGDEKSVQYCNNGTARVEKCYFYNFAGVVCTNVSTKVQLKPIPSKSSGVITDGLKVRLIGEQKDGFISNGYLEVLYDGVWGAVCPDNWIFSNSYIACGHLGYPDVMADGSNEANSKIDDYSPSHFWLNNVKCSGTESSLVECEHSGWKRHVCKRNAPVYLNCKRSPLLRGHRFDKALISQHKVRIRSGYRHSEGRAEILHNGKWGSICHDNWSIQDANVFCREVGFGTAYEATHYAASGQGSGKVWLDEVQCKGTESTVQECKHAGWEKADCGHKEDAGVKCHYPYGKIDLVMKLHGHHNPLWGHVRVLHEGRWKGVCGIGFGIREAGVVCRQLGFGYPKSAVSSTRYGMVRSMAIFDVKCSGDELSLADCHHKGPATGRCRYYDIATVQCTPYAPDLVMDVLELKRSVKLTIRPLSWLMCAYEENCLGSDAKYQTWWPERFNRTLLRFSARFWNRGTADFRPSVRKERWEWHQCHSHYHSMERFADYDLTDKRGFKVGEGHKASFCLEDFECEKGVEKIYNCARKGDQGVTVNCADTYKNHLDCQWIDVTQLPTGTYKLRVVLNPQNLVYETDYSNNIATCDLEYTFMESAKVGACQIQPCEQMSYGGVGDGACCKFPFVFRGKQYHKCIREGREKGGFLWCATTSSYDKDGLWGKCGHFTSRNANRDSGAPSTVTEHLSVSESDDEKKVEQEDTFKCSVVEVADNPDPSVINQKYFSTLDFRNSNEFRRLISTASTCSSNRYSDSERHCVSPVGGYK